MSYADKVFDNFGSNLMQNMHTSFPAIVVSFNEEEAKATVQPLYMFDNENSYPQIQNIPVIKQRFKMKAVATQVDNHTHGFSWSGESGSGTTIGAGAHTHNITFLSGIEEEVEYSLFIKAGDIVLCTCCEKANDLVSTKQVYNPQSKRQFDLTDSVIIGIIFQGG